MQKFLSWIKKAIAGGVAAGSAAFIVAITKGTFTKADLALVIGAAIVGGIGVFFVPANGPKP